MVKIAYKTLQAIDDAVAYDQGAAYRRNLGLVIPHIGDAYDDKLPEPRSHLGASILGQDCGRAVAYSWRWFAADQRFKGRMVCLFNRGHLEEARFIALLLTIGVQVYQQDANGKQYRITFAEGHGGGSGDGVAVGLPELVNGVAALCEFKTHNTKSFSELAGDLPSWRAHLSDRNKPFKGKGVREAKPEHFIQAQLYMRKMGLACGLYMAVNKDTDDLYAEIITLEENTADEFLNRADTIVWSDKLPTRINKSPGFFKCKFCDFARICHYKAPAPMNCRTCKYSKPVVEATWVCSLHNKALDKATQLAGCNSWDQLPND